MSTLDRERFWALLHLLVMAMLLAADYYWLLANLNDPRVKGMVNSCLRDEGPRLIMAGWSCRPWGGPSNWRLAGFITSALPRICTAISLDLNWLTVRWSSGSLLRQEILIQEVQLTGLVLHWVQALPVPLSHTFQMADLPRGTLRVKSFYPEQIDADLEQNRRQWRCSASGHF